MRRSRVALSAAVAGVTLLSVVFLQALLGANAKEIPFGILESASFGPASVTGIFHKVLQSFKQTWAPRSDGITQAEQLEIFAQDSQWINGLVSWMLPDAVRSRANNFFLGWFRNWFFGSVLYYGLGAFWVYYAYFCFGSKYFEEGNVPAVQDMLEQIKVGTIAMPGYALLPTITDCIVEKGWTRAYARIDDVGMLNSFSLFLLYMAFVEFGVYWSHRLLHEIPLGYKLLHNVHHKYNKEHTLSPFAGLAFHPLDGILQAVPYTVTLFIVPLHYTTHVLLLFLTGVWTTNIHDCIDGEMDPIMGAGYHTIHHTSYKDNYGHYFIFMDWLFGTLITPEQYEKRVREQKKVD